MPPKKTWKPPVKPVAPAPEPVKIPQFIQVNGKYETNPAFTASPVAPKIAPIPMSQKLASPSEKLQTIIKALKPTGVTPTAALNRPVRGKQVEIPGIFGSKVTPKPVSAAPSVTASPTASATADAVAALIQKTPKERGQEALQTVLFRGASAKLPIKYIGKAAPPLPLSSTPVVTAAPALTTPAAPVVTTPAVTKPEAPVVTTPALAKPEAPKIATEPAAPIVNRKNKPPQKTDLEIATQAIQNKTKLNTEKIKEKIKRIKSGRESRPFFAPNLKDKLGQIEYRSKRKLQELPQKLESVQKMASNLNTSQKTQKAMQLRHAEESATLKPAGFSSSLAGSELKNTRSRFTQLFTSKKTNEQKRTLMELQAVKNRRQLEAKQSKEKAERNSKISKLQSLLTASRNKLGLPQK